MGTEGFESVMNHSDDSLDFELSNKTFDSCFIRSLVFVNSTVNPCRVKSEIDSKDR
jgi:hypothetical protein